MTDVLIRNVPDADLRRIDAKAKKMGLGRAEFLRRQIAQVAAQGPDGDDLTLDDFTRFAELASDMLDPDFERRAWSCEAG
jgi:hypothetical protein